MARKRRQGRPCSGHVKRGKGIFGSVKNFAKKHWKGALGLATAAAAAALAGKVLKGRKRHVLDGVKIIGDYDDPAIAKAEAHRMAHYPFFPTNRIPWLK